MIGGAFVATRVTLLPGAQSERIDRIREEIDQEARILGDDPFVYFGRNPRGEWEIALGDSPGASLGISIRDHFENHEKFIWAELVSGGRWALVEVDNGMPVLESTSAGPRDFARARIRSTEGQPVFVARDHEERLSSELGGLEPFQMHILDEAVLESIEERGILKDARRALRSLLNTTRLVVIAGALIVGGLTATVGLVQFAESQYEQVAISAIDVSRPISLEERSETFRLQEIDVPVADDVLGLIWGLVRVIPSEAAGWRVSRIQSDNTNVMQVEFAGGENSERRALEESLDQFAALTETILETVDIGDTYATVTLSGIRGGLAIEQGRGINDSSLEADAVRTSLNDATERVGVDVDRVNFVVSKSEFTFDVYEWTYYVENMPAIWLDAIRHNLQDGPEVLLRGLDLRFAGFVLSSAQVDLRAVVSKRASVTEEG